MQRGAPASPAGRTWPDPDQDLALPAPCRPTAPAGAPLLRQARELGRVKRFAKALFYNVRGNAAWRDYLVLVSHNRLGDWMVGSTACLPQPA